MRRSSAADSDKDERKTKTSEQKVQEAEIPVIEELEE